MTSTSIPPAHATARSSVSVDNPSLRSPRRLVLAFAIGFLTFVSTTGGLFVVAPRIQSAIVAGIAVGLTSRRVIEAGWIGLAAAALGSLVGPQNTWLSNQAQTDQTVTLVASIACCALVAVLACLLARQHPKMPTVLMGVALVVLIVNMWLTPLRVNSVSAYYPYLNTRMPSFNEQLEQGVIPESVAGADNAWFFRIYQRVNAGEDYYPAVAWAYEQNPGWKGGPWSTADVRMPTLYWVWALLPNARAIVIAFLALATLAVVAVVPLTPTQADAPLALAGCAALASYLIRFPWEVNLFANEEWAAALAVCALAAYAISTSSPKWRTWVSVAVVLIALAVLVREIMAPIFLAGVASGFVGPRSQRRYRLAAWTTASIVVVAGYAAHYVALRPYLHPTGELPRIGQGGVGFMLLALDFGTDFLGKGGWLPVALLVMGILGALLSPDVRSRVFAAGGIFATILAFLAFGNNAISVIGAQNYWGSALLPVVYACAPGALLLIGGVTAARSPE